MKKTNRRFLAYAVALAASFAAVPGVTQAAPAETTQAQAAADTETAPKAAAAPATAADTNTANTANAASAAPGSKTPVAASSEPSAAQKDEQKDVDPRTAEWAKNRPQEDMIEKYSKGSDLFFQIKTFLRNYPFRPPLFPLTPLPLLQRKERMCCQ